MDKTKSDSIYLKLRTKEGAKCVVCSDLAAPPLVNHVIYHFDSNPAKFENFAIMCPTCARNTGELCFNSHLDIRFLGNKDYVDGTLRSGFFKSEKDYIVSFIGNADVTFDGMCDRDDLNTEAPFIKGYMLHFIAEFKNTTLQEMMLYQRLFARIVYDELRSSTICSQLRITGNDIYVGDRKLSVGIATSTITNTQIMHYALNITKGDCPLDVEYLSRIAPNIDPRSFSINLMKIFNKEVEKARKKCSAVLMAEHVPAMGGVV